MKQQLASLFVVGVLHRTRCSRPARAAGRIAALLARCVPAAAAFSAVTQLPSLLPCLLALAALQHRLQGTDCR